MATKEEFYKPKEVAIIDGKETVVVYVPLFIPKVLVDGGAIETFAILEAHWKDKINTTPIIDEATGLPSNDPVTGIQLFNQIDNPVTAERAGINYIQDMVDEKYKEIVAKQGADQGRQQALNYYESLKS